MPNPATTAWPGDEDPDGQLVTWAPGMLASLGLPGSAWRVQPKTSLVLHSHLQPSGKRETVQFRIGLHFADAPPTQRPIILRIGSRNVDIPAGEPRHIVRDTYKLPIAVDVHSIFPHAHSLCKVVRVRAKLPDGSERPLIWIEHFDEKWHDNYRFAEPVRLPRGTELITEFAYDNTDANVRNRHHPPERTVYGSNAADEMQDVYLQVTAVAARPASRPDGRFPTGRGANRSSSATASRSKCIRMIRGVARASPPVILRSESRRMRFVSSTSGSR